MPKETMTPRERWLAVLQRKQPDRVPMDYWATGEATAKLLKYLGCDFDTMLRRLHIDRPAFTPSDAVSYTHLTLPTKRIV